MKMKSLIFAAFFLSLSGCSSIGVHVTDNKEGWINVNNGWDYTQLYWCEVNRTNGNSDPVCVKPKFQDTNEDKSRAK